MSVIQASRGRFSALLSVALAAGLPACTWSPVQDLRFACAGQDQCATGFVCRGGECHPDDGTGGGSGGGGGGGGGCNPGEVQACLTAGCAQACVDGSFGACEPTTGGPFDSNPQHCGECGRACPSLSCVEARCTCMVDADCPIGQVCKAGGLCATSADSCASVKCPPNQVCRGGGCGATPCGASCEVGEVCEADAGVCRPILACHIPEACGDGGVCEGGPRADGTGCDDGFACSSNDVCTGGVCAGDAGLSLTYRDSDGDGYGDSAASSTSCPPPPGYVAIGGDCDDTNASVHPGATEVCNGVDDNCDAVIDEGVKTAFYPDTDSDGVGGPTPVMACTAPAGYVATTGDCDDANANVFQTVASVQTDQDQDGYTSGAAAAQCVGATQTAGGRTYYRAAGGGYSWLDSSASLGVDCDDLDAGKLGQATWYQDGDGDGAGGATTQQACTAPAGYVATGGDCDDSDPQVYRTVANLVNDSDQDGHYTGAAGSQCVGASTSVGSRIYYRGTSGNSNWLNATQALGAGDCLDTDADVYQTVTNLLQDSDNDGYPLTGSG